MLLITAIFLRIIVYSFAKTSNPAPFRPFLPY
jgi:hypothetical protein